jgi:hypothetical protein
MTVMTGVVVQLYVGVRYAVTTTHSSSRYPCQTEPWAAARATQQPMIWQSSRWCLEPSSPGSVSLTVRLWCNPQPQHRP